MPRARSPRRFPTHLGLALLLVLVTAAPGTAQISTATVQGKVSDQTGVLPGVTVTARETDSGFSRDATADAEVPYTLAGLRPGSVIFQGFNVFSVDDFSAYQGNIPTLPATNPNFGRPSSLIDPGRRMQFGLRYGF